MGFKDKFKKNNKPDEKPPVPVRTREVPKEIGNRTSVSSADMALLVASFIPLGLIGSLTIFALRKLTALWRKIVSWIKKQIQKVIKIIEGFKYFIAGRVNGMVERLHEYWKEDEQWYRKETVEKISEKEVPPEILEKYNRKKGNKVMTEYDATQELKQQLELCA